MDDQRKKDNASVTIAKYLEPAIAYLPWICVSNLIHSIHEKRRTIMLGPNMQVELRARTRVETGNGGTDESGKFGFQLSSRIISPGDPLLLVLIPLMTSFRSRRG